MFKIFDDFIILLKSLNMLNISVTLKISDPIIGYRMVKTHFMQENCIGLLKIVQHKSDLTFV
jgi:hypothetical protein